MIWTGTSLSGLTFSGNKAQGRWFLDAYGGDGCQFYSHFGRSNAILLLDCLTKVTGIPITRDVAWDPINQDEASPQMTASRSQVKLPSSFCDLGFASFSCFHQKALTLTAILVKVLL